MATHPLRGGRTKIIDRTSGLRQKMELGFVKTRLSFSCDAGAEGPILRPVEHSHQLSRPVTRDPRNSTRQRRLDAIQPVNACMIFHLTGNGAPL